MSAIASAGSGSLQAFAARDLPGLVRRMVRGDSRVRVCQTLGAALYQSLALEAVEIALAAAAGEGVVFAACRDGAFDRPGHSLRTPDDALVLRVSFADHEQRRSLEPVLATALALAGVAEPVGEAQADQEEPDAEAELSLPEPATLDPEVGAIYEQAVQLAEGDIGVLIRGRSGSGKEVLAQFIHRASPRAGKGFLALNCAALPTDLLEAELFGVERGVATGVDARAGLFERAHGGTLFLDEVGDMAADTQAKILRVMQEGEVRRLGGAESRPAEARIVAATNRDLEAMIATGEFRNDLYHRLTAWQVTLPPLHERRADLVNLAAYFLDREATRLGIETVGLERAAMRALLAYQWPGNVRQLEREMVRAALFLADRQPLGVAHLQNARPPAPMPEILSLEAYLEAVERRAISRALDACQGDVVQAASRLDVGRSTLYRRLKQLGIATPE